MSIDFNKHIERKHTGSMKWSFAQQFLTPEQAAADPLPLWVADMDFKSPPEVLEALKNAVDNDIMGYASPKESYYKAVCGWQKKRFNWDVDPSWLVLTPGVVTALNIAIQAFTEPGDSILIQPPVYVHFHEDVKANNRRVVSAPLCWHEDGSYTYDAKTFEAAIEKDTKLFILSNPHNPTGNAWSEEDLRSMAEICKRHNVIVISDEIHEDLIFNPAVKHFTFARLGEEHAQNCIVCTAPSKTFNIAGLQTSNIFIPNPEIRAQFKQQAIKNGINLTNYLGLIACEAAYAKGEAWLTHLLEHVKDNHDYLVQELKDVPQVKVTPTDSLYLAWVDFRGLNMNTTELMDFLTIKARVWLDNGVKFAEEGHGFMRVNLGCTRPVLEEAVKRMKTAIAAL